MALGKAVDFEETSSQYIDVGQQASTLRLTGTSYSISAWVKLESITNTYPDNYRCIIGMDDSANFSGGYAISVIYNATANHAFWTHNANDGNRNWESGVVVPTGEWIHLVFVYDKAGGQRYIYHNGSNTGDSTDKLATNADLTSDNDDKFIIGANAGGTIFPFDGIIDQVLVYNKALSSTEVSQIYNGGTGTLDIPTGNLIGRWELDEGADTTANDTSASGFDGTLINTPTWVDGKVPLPITRYWIGGTGNWSDTANWSYVSGGDGGADVPTSADNVFVDASSGFGSGGTITLDNSIGNQLCNNLTCTSGHTYTIDGTTTSIIAYGDVVLEAGQSWGAGNEISLGRATYGTNKDLSFTTNGASLELVEINNTGFTVTLQDDITANSEFYLTGGTFNANNHNITAGDFYFGYSGDSPTFTMGSGTFTATSNDSVYDPAWTVDETSTPETVTINAGTSTIKLTDTTANNKTFTGGGKTYNNIWIAGNGTGTFILADANTFNDFKIDAKNTVKFTESTTTTVTTFTATATNGNEIVLDSVDGATQFTLSDSTGTNTVTYLDISNSNAIGGATWVALNSNDTTNNDGWVFEVAPNTPSITSPTASETGVDRNPTLTGSAFSDPNVGQTHKASDWKITSDAGLSTVVWSKSNDTTNKTSIVVNTTNGTFAGALAGETKLAELTDYYVSVRYQDNLDEWSAWATAVKFTTKQDWATIATTEKLIGQVKREYFETKLGYTKDKLYDLEKAYFASLGYTGNRLIEIEKKYLKAQLVSTTDSYIDLWNEYFASKSVPAGTLSERWKYLYANNLL